MKTQPKIDIHSFDLSIVEKCRSYVRSEAVIRYKIALINAGKWIFPPLTIWKDGDVNYLLDGHHRLLAVQDIQGFTTVPVIEKTFKDKAEAKRFALHANTTHGEKLTKEEIRANIRAFLIEGGATISDSAIANLFGVCRALVADVRTNRDGMTKKEKAEADVAKILEANPTATITEIAEKAQLSRTTAKKISKALHDKATAQPAPQGVITDCFGREIPQSNIDKRIKIQMAIKGCSNALTDFNSSVERMMNVGAFAQSSEVEIIQNAIKQIKSVLKNRRPDALCTCRGDGCRKCGGTGFLEKTMFNVIVPESDK